MTSPLRSAASAVIGATADNSTMSIQNYVIASMGPTSTTVDSVPGMFLNIGGTPVQVPYPDSITSPAAGQTVRVLMINNVPTVLARVIGLPTSNT